MTTTRRFDFSLSAGKLFPLFIGFYLPCLVLYALLVIASQEVQEKNPDPAAIWVTLGAFLGLFLLYLFFAIPFTRRILPALTLEGKPLAFRGSIGRFVGLNLLGAFLSLITLGIYAPWYIARIYRYLAQETSFEGRPWAFAGKGGRLFVILLLSLVLPITVIAVLVGVFAALSGAGTGLLRWLSPIILVLLLFLMPAYIYEIYRWFFTNLRLEELSVRWRTRFWPSVGTIFLQGLLSLVTAGIYLPAAYVKLYRYFVQRTELERGGQPSGRLGFDGTAGQGFLCIWGQGLLAIITIGIYYPWALAKVGRWFAGHTMLDT
jgi:uncharacterized membrane protein YjgN (DUF898 family)